MTNGDNKIHRLPCAATGSAIAGYCGGAILIALLIGAVLWDWRLRSRSARVEGAPLWIDAAVLADQLLRNRQPLVVDVRRPDEFNGQSGHIPGARNISLAEIRRRIGDLAQFKTVEVVLVCRTQLRSAKAAEMLKDAGFRHVAVLRGGME